MIKKSISLGKADGYGNGRKSCLVTLDLEIRPAQGDNRRTIDLEPREAGAVELSIVGNVWNNIQTDIISGGQNHAQIRKHFRGNRRVRRICEIWERWHLNGMKSGTRAQSERLDAHKAKILAETGKPWRYDYSEACEILKAAGLYEDRGYKYGHEWLHETIPAEILAEIKELFKVDESSDPTDPRTVWREMDEV